jgi:hypothetical protein
MSEGVPVARLYSDAGSQPGISLGVLISPAEDPPWSATNVAFGGNNLALAANTPYWIVLTSAWHAWRATPDSCDTATCGPACSTLSMHTSSSAWYPDTWTLKMQVDVVEASAVPEPSSVWLLLPLAGAPLYRRRRRA